MRCSHCPGRLSHRWSAGICVSDPGAKTFKGKFASASRTGENGHSRTSRGRSRTYRMRCRLSARPADPHKPLIAFLAFEKSELLPQHSQLTTPDSCSDLSADGTAKSVTKGNLALNRDGRSIRFGPPRARPRHGRWRAGSLTVLAPRDASPASDISAISPTMSQTSASH